MRTDSGAIFAVPAPHPETGGISVVSQEPGAVLELSQTLAPATVLHSGVTYDVQVSASQMDGAAACEIKVLVGGEQVVDAVPGEKVATFNGAWTPVALVAGVETPLTVQVGHCKGLDGVVSIKGLKLVERAPQELRV